MLHSIDPKIDCVFKALLGSEANRDLLIHFLNAILGPNLPAPITWVQILNPFNEREIIGDKLSIVDVKAIDEHQCLHQIEIQLLNQRDLPARMLYTWAKLYGKQIEEGDPYRLLRPTFAIWLLGENLLADTDTYAHDFRLRDATGRCLGEHGGIWLLELKKFHADQVQTEEERWLKFFKEGHALDSDLLPPWMQTTEMKQAMNTLKAFSERERAYWAYQARLDYLRQQRGMQMDMEEELAARKQAESARKQAETARKQAETERDRAETERAQAETERAQAETERDRAETERAQAETARAQAETARKQVEAALEQERAAKEAALAELERIKAQGSGT